MKNIFKILFGKKDNTDAEKPNTPIPNIKVYDEHGNLEENDLQAAAINECFRTGKPVIANKDSQGNITFK